LSLASDPSELETASAFVMLAGLLLWESLMPCMSFFKDAVRSRLVHGVRNFALGLVNAACTAALLSTLWAAATAWAARTHFGVLNWLDLQGAWRWVALLLLFDCWMYGWHRAMHRIPLLWRLHRVHHSDPQMDVTTAQRFHFGEIILSSLARTPVLALLGMTLDELTIYETLAFAVVQLQHANVALPPTLERVARWLIVTPALHKVHHSRIRAETDSNYASLLAWWDLLFQSRRQRSDLHTISFGLDGYDAAQYQSIVGLLALPRSRV
jgi:sterol desaturase/sphingolipid hydroxylase (fatty acid hydroxylase superfamily)